MTLVLYTEGMLEAVSKRGCALLSLESGFAACQCIRKSRKKMSTYQQHLSCMCCKDRLY